MDEIEIWQIQNVLCYGKNEPDDLLSGVMYNNRSAKLMTSDILERKHQR